MRYFSEQIAETHGEVEGGLKLRNELWLPYCYVKLSYSGRIWLALNRKYKPLGLTQYVDYDDHIASATVFMSDPTRFPGIWTFQQRRQLWLYRDGMPDSEYFKRLQKLLNHGHRGVEARELESFKRTIKDTSRGPISVESLSSTS